MIRKKANIINGKYQEWQEDKGPFHSDDKLRETYEYDFYNNTKYNFTRIVGCIIA